MTACMGCVAYYEDLKTSVWCIDGLPSVFGLRVLELARVVGGRLMRGFEVHVRVQEEGNYAFWCSTDLLLSKHDILLFFERCVSEYFGRPVVADRPEAGIQNPYGGWL